MRAGLTLPLKWHGGKNYLADRITELMPPHTHYVEAFAGGLSVLLAKEPEGVSEVANDLNGRLTNFWRVLRDLEHFARFLRMVEATPFSQPEWDASRALRDDPDPVVAAYAFFVHCRQSLAGRGVSFASLSRTRTRRNMNEQASAWLGCIEGLPAVHRRLSRVAILNAPAVDVIRQQDGPATLFYLDPPYVPRTRIATQVYEHEMSVEEHVKLIARIKDVKGKVMLSGYGDPLYDEPLQGWTRHTFDLPNNSAGGGIKNRMTEVLWCNF